VQRKILTLVATAALLLPLAGCGEKDPGLAKVDRAAKITMEIDLAPDSGEEILKKHGMTKAEYMQLVLEISKDERLAPLYQKKIGR